MAKGKSNGGLIRRAGIWAILLLGLWSAFELFRIAGPRPRNNFSGTTLAGRTWTLNQHLRTGPVIVNFFGLFCGGCRQEFPHLVELERKYAERGLKLVVIARDAAADLRADPVVGPAKIEVIGDGGHIFDQYGIDALPHTIVFGADGKLLREMAGFSSYQIEEIDRFLQSSLPPAGRQASSTIRQASTPDVRESSVPHGGR